MFYNKITQIEFELTTKCNASCPQCVRNFYGSNVIDNLPLVDLDLNIIKEKISHATLANLIEIRICGTYGDPCVYTNLIDLIIYLKSKTDAQITINTNGSLRTVEWWKKLANVLSCDDRVIFGIDGLKDTNHLYRIGTNFDKIINNASAFIAGGGSAIWSYIVFKHNEHQVEEAKELSKTLGFDGFACKLTTRFIDKKHNLVDKTPVYSKTGSIVRYLEMPVNTKYLNSGYNNYETIIKEYRSYKDYLQKSEISCTAQHSNLVYISAEGYVLPCGWLADRFYGVEAENHHDKLKLSNLIDSNGGKSAIDLHHHTLEEIINNNVFQAIQKNWKENNRIERCANQCGKYGMLKQNATKELQPFVKGNV
jgi:MoaA/NifB/PqqE/SkfB family radical SAM enzyme